MESDYQTIQSVGSATVLRNGECLGQPQQLQLAGHSIACAPNPYPDLYYGGMMPANGPQPMVHPLYYGAHHQPGCLYQLKWHKSLFMSMLNNIMGFLGVDSHLPMLSWKRNC